ncbi:MAG TPA: hypothetical protein VMU19_07255, partial [Bryobacteraceae bacterium]|nr:hypothetical protein [Bryobacteraceae bacterium]
MVVQSAVTHEIKSLAVAAALLAMSGAAFAQTQRLAENTQQQIGALLAEKASRTAAQAKMDSHLVHAAQILRGQPVSPDFPNPPGELDAVHKDANDAVLVDIKGQVSPDLLGAIRSAGGTVVSSFAEYGSVRARIPLLNVERVAARDDVQQIRMAESAMINGAPLSLGARPGFAARGAAVRARLAALMAGRQGGKLPAPMLASLLSNLGSAFFAPPEGPDTYGDTAHQASNARVNFNLDGTGVKLGLLSDGVDSLSSEQTKGNLPNNLTVITGQAGAGDEGTAMLEIVY